MANILDQQQATVDNAYSFGNSFSQRQAQSFLPSVSAFMSQVIIRTDVEASPTGQIKMELYSNNAGVPGSLIQAADATQNPSAGADVTYTFTGGPKLDGGTTYWLVISRTTALDDDNYFYLSCSSTTPANPYANGVLLFYDGGSWSDNDPSVNDDAYFKEYYESTTVVPVGKLGLLGVGA